MTQSLLLPDSCRVWADRGEIYADELVDKVKEYTDALRDPFHFLDTSDIIVFKWWMWGRLRSTVVVLHLLGSITDHEQKQKGIVADRVLAKLNYLNKATISKGIGGDEFTRGFYSIG